ncbi:TetR/AcrR family transcriptional regulator [Shimazuella kribbensis]|uniref:TetR/AcrR family transcriptional regulator n=1 Tax=Shimazuella kribbensis TaxID=139808 RepID=UPI0004299950|nr:TetR/AcrR family transcriptional regulator [Shimazuella kribbensis]
MGEGVQRKTKKRENILQAAERLFLQKGIRSVSIEEIAKGAKASKTTLYKYFADKQEILEAFLQDISQSVLERLEGIYEKGTKNGLTREDFLDIFDVEQYSYFFQSSFTTELVSEFPSSVEKLYGWMQGRLIPLFHELVDMAKEQGIVRKEVDTEILITYSLLMRRNFTETPQIPSHMSMKEFTQKFYDLYLHGVVERD